MGRRLVALLVEAGLRVERVDGVASAPPLRSITPNLRDAITSAVDDSELDRARAEQFVADLQERIDRGVATSTWIAFEVAARKP
jgi:hypothetical protein